ncbi:MAG: 2,3-bisphosphoglycerate-independent phosphoglycerate mutase, partial [Fusobacterium sp.]
MLMILDGWGINECNSCVNAIKSANPKEFTNLISNYPHSKLEASGEAVGLPKGQ